MTAVVATFPYQGRLDLAQAQSLGSSYIHLGVRKIEIHEQEQTISVEYDATRMDQYGVAALLRRLRIPVQDS